MKSFQMFSFFFSRNLKNKLILYFLIITIVPSIIISFFYYTNSRLTLEKNAIDTSLNRLNFAMDGIDKQLKNIGQLSDSIYINKDLTKILSTYPIKDYPELMKFWDPISNQLGLNTFVLSYVTAFVIHGENGLDLRTGTTNSFLIDLVKVQKTEWFQEGIKQENVTWYGIVENPVTIKYEDYIIPLVRPIKHWETYRKIGWQVIGFRPTVISDLFNNFAIEPDETLLVIDARGFCVYHNQSGFIGQYLGEMDYLKQILKRKTGGNFQARINGATQRIVFTKSPKTGWSIVQTLSSAQLNRQRGLLLGITLIILLASLVFTSLLTIYLSTNLTQPLQHLLQRTKAIAKGSFAPEPSIEGDDELGSLGRGINEMALNIQNLMDLAIKDEQEKRRLELAVLQNQINPHFLYNTLNSLKLMATLQKADGIREMVTALGHLVMNLFKNTSEEITLDKEIALLKDYVYIQNIRYQGKIKLEVHLEDPVFAKCKVVKFSLQPIVENAIFHGIEPKKDAGKIVITVSRDGPLLVLCIEDDGVGMTPEQIEAVLAGSASGSATGSTQSPLEGQTRGLSGIGVKNVDQRIKYIYGVRFGLSIESVPGVYTRIYMRIPYHEAEENEIEQEPRMNANGRE
ncbi:MAG TPA: sensor histidine kinase [Bacillota bacterium]|nr:sensor histidine kinase [Bacillota bacterium]